MTALALMPAASLTVGQQAYRSSPSASTSQPTVSFWQPRVNVFRSPRPARGAAHGPRASGRSGYRGCAPGMMGPGFGVFMNRTSADILQQLEREFSNAAEQARQAQQRQNNGSSNVTHTEATGLPVDTVESDDAVWYFIDLPGLEKRDLKIQANQQDRSIKVSGERIQPSVGEDEEKLKRSTQRRFGKFSHNISLPKDADAQLISAKVDQGVLRIKVLKAKEAEPELQNVQID